MDELFDSVDVEAEIEDQLPEDHQSLSGPATAGLREGSYQLWSERSSSPAAAAVGTLDRAVARTLVRVLEGEEGTVSTEGGVSRSISR